MPKDNLPISTLNGVFNFVIDLTRIEHSRRMARVRQTNRRHQGEQEQQRQEVARC
jgi:hypothetical protein